MHTSRRRREELFEPQNVRGRAGFPCVLLEFCSVLLDPPPGFSTLTCSLKTTTWSW